MRAFIFGVADLDNEVENEENNAREQERAVMMVTEAIRLYMSDERFMT